ncbi:hypothetical protein [Peribacillus butanolivorans]|uniref:hypothetical protein n=1 Tax=Peribacillus butanolivorans TaxID=421767 RepID=UPI003821F09D
MDQSKLIQKIEEISMNALPALQTQIYDFPPEDSLFKRVKGEMNGVWHKLK